MVENLVEGDELRTDVAAIAAHVERLGPENVACIITTTSCFAPRGADCVVAVVRVADTFHTWTKKPPPWILNYEFRDHVTID